MIFNFDFDYDYDVDPHEQEEQEEEDEEGCSFLSLFSKPKDYYKILEVESDATDDTIRSNYIRLALKWHPDKKKEEEGAATSIFQDINEAYQILSDPEKRREYDLMQHVYDYTIIEYLDRYKGLILTCNGLGMNHSLW